jgi:hypothetical protein
MQYTKGTTDINTYVTIRYVCLYMYHTHSIPNIIYTQKEILFKFITLILCMYLCMYDCMYVLMYLNIYVCVCVCVCVCVYA